MKFITTTALDFWDWFCCTDRHVVAANRARAEAARAEFDTMFA